ncbi:hypothetical protein [Paenibacillus senegalensis]|uniref:hypothetical protein n=1 Tax=Paenibacillus senegalensis TaxID=1465766 RepID=UPI00028A1C1F|nr:hypothetical protein [Paenibacillus senegalensis]
MRWNKQSSLLCLLGAALLTSSCAEKVNWKEQAITALSKHEEITSYTFTGRADLDINHEAKTTSNPIVDSLQQSLLQGSLSWEGTAALSPLRIEATFAAGAAVESSAMKLPVLFADNSLYVNIPLINKPEEYFQIEFAELAQLTGSDSALTDERLKQTAHLFAELHSELYSSVEERWFSRLDAEESNPDGSFRIGIEITEENQEELSLVIRDHWPGIVDTLHAYGLLSQEQTTEWREKGQSLTLHAPGQLSVEINGEGYASSQRLDLTYSWDEGSPQTIRLEQSYDDINQNPQFQKEIPEQALPFSQVLRLFFPAARQD